jgi:hypothetical protein
MGGRLLTASRSVLLGLQFGLIAGLPVQAQVTGIAGARVSLPGYEGPATLAATTPKEGTLRIEVDPHTETQPLTLSVELPATSQTTWAADVEVVEATGKPLPVRHPGIEWHKLSFTVPAQQGTYLVRIVEPRATVIPVLADAEREATEPTTGLRARIARWYDGRKAALSLRFDDAHPSHLSTVIPILRECGFRGTFMVCPGQREPNRRQGSDFEEHRAEWEAVAQRGDQELANHSAHHRGAVGDEDMEREIGGASEAIWQLCPGKSKLLALNLGGGTTWETTRPLRYYLDKYHLFDASSGSLGMDDVYGDRLGAFREHLERHIERGLWCRIHYHSVGDKLSTSEANFRAALDLAQQHSSDLWIAGMADIHKYQTERQAAKLTVGGDRPGRVLLKLSCVTDAELYDQPLTIEVTLPPDWPAEGVRATSVTTGEVAIPVTSVPQGGALRFHLPPITAEYVLERAQKEASGQGPGRRSGRIGIVFWSAPARTFTLTGLLFVPMVRVPEPSARPGDRTT